MPKKILVVDDDPSTIHLVETILNTEGYETLSAVDGLDAMVKIKKHHPHLVVLDIVMPEINGYDVCYQLRYNKEYESIPIVLLTERQQEISDDIGRKVNIEYLHKPLKSKDLIDKVNSFLKK